MFDERDDALLAHLRSEEERYVAWECEMEKAVRGLNGSGGGKRLVLLEIGSSASDQYIERNAEIARHALFVTKHTKESPPGD